MQGTFEFALDAKFNKAATSVSAYGPRVMLKIVLLAYSRGLISSAGIGEHPTLQATEQANTKQQGQSEHAMAPSLKTTLKKLDSHVVAESFHAGKSARAYFAKGARYHRVLKCEHKL
jgi:hypothetical protein